MIDAQLFVEKLLKEGVNFFAGVPDSLLKGFNTCLQTLSPNQHQITVNEGAAVAIAAGHYLATGRTPVVYLQNSGLGNIINPLTSLIDPQSYSIPLLFLIGWRGQPGKKDEPQHLKMGRVTLPLLEALELPYKILSIDESNHWDTDIEEAMQYCKDYSAPFALVVESGYFAGGDLPMQADYELSAEMVLEELIQIVSPDSKMVCTTGKIGRLYYELAKKNAAPPFFLNTGAMGHAGSLAAALAMHSNKEIILLDGDGSLLMHMGAMATIGSLSLNRLHYIVLNNGVHESVGGQPTAGFKINFCDVATACGFTKVSRVVSKADIQSCFQQKEQTSRFTEIRINSFVRNDLSRPTESPIEMKKTFMQSFQSE